MNPEHNPPQESTTPVLDLQLPFGAAKSSQWLGNEMTTKDVLILAAVLLGAVLGVMNGAKHELVIQLSDRVNAALQAFFELFDVITFPNIFLAAAVLLPMVAVHESGHAIAAKLNGLRLLSIKVGPIWILGRDKRVLFGPRDLLGFVVAEFTSVRRIRRRYFWLTVSGPLANVFVGLPLQITAIYVAPPIGNWIHIAGAVSLWLAVLSLWPYRPTTHGSDGYQIKRLFCGKRSYASWLANIALDISSANGAELSSWRRRWLDKAAQADQKDPVWKSAQLRFYAWASDKKDIQVASEHLEVLLVDAASASRSHRNSLALEAAVFQAWHRQDAGKAEVWAGRVSEFAAMPELQQIRYYASFFCCTGEFEKSLAQWERGLSMLKSMSSSDRTKTIVKSWTKWRDEIEERRTIFENRQTAEPLDLDLTTAEATEPH